MTKHPLLSTVEHMDACAACTYYMVHEFVFLPLLSARKERLTISARSGEYMQQGLSHVWVFCMTPCQLFGKPLDKCLSIWFVLHVV